MLGPQQDRRLCEPVLAALDGLVPRDNCYRHLEASLDLSFVRDWVADKYAERGRVVQRPLDSAYLDRVRGDHATEAYQQSMRKRAVWVEPLFGEAKEGHHLRKFRLRGLAKVNSAGQLVAAGQTLKRWLKATGWGRRPVPGVTMRASFTRLFRAPSAPAPLSRRPADRPGDDVFNTLRRYGHH